MAGGLDEKVAGLAPWGGRSVSVRPLKGGLSNTSFVVEDGHERFVVRCGQDIPVHHVFRDHERAASKAAHAVGLSPELVHQEPGVMIFRFVPGKTWTEQDMRAGIGPLVALLRRCHGDMGRRFAGPARAFWVFHVLRDYAATLHAGGARFDRALQHLLAHVDALEERQVPMPVVFGHHDLLPGNVMDDGSRLWLIDWEYGAFGTAMFDLANVSTNGGFSPLEDERLLVQYFGEHPGQATQVAFDAMKVASTLREALWALVSAQHLDVPGVDYAAHGAEYLARSQAALAAFIERHGSP